MEFPPEYWADLGLNIKFNLSLLENETGNNSNFSYMNPNDDNFNHKKALFIYYLMGIGGTTVCFIGIICNILSVVVLTRRVMNSSTYSYLASLAVCDTLALFMTVTISLLSKDIHYPVKGQIAWSSDVYAYLFPYLHPSAVTFQVTSIWLTLAFTVDRYIMICHPFKAESMCSVKRARKVIVCIYMLGLLFNIPRFLEYTHTKSFVPSLHNETLVHVNLEYTELGLSKLFIDLVHSYLYLTFVCGIPFLTLAILNTFLMHAVHMSRKRGRQINAKEKKRNDTTIMLIGVIIIFLACQGPALISRMVYAIDFHMATTSMTFHKINETGNFLIIVNSAINIVPYYFFGKRFRREFWRIFCKCIFSQQELRKMTRSLSFSVDNRRRVSQCSMASHHEMNGLQSDNYTGALHHRDSNSPLLPHSLRDYRDNNYHADITHLANLHTGLNHANNHQQQSSQTPSNGSAQPLKVVWEMDDNKNEKYNVKIQLTEASDSSEL